MNFGGLLTQNTPLADSHATGEDAIAIGGDAKAAEGNSVALGINLIADHANNVSVGSEGKEPLTSRPILKARTRDRQPADRSDPQN